MRALAVAVAVAACPDVLFAQSRPVDLGSLSLEELLNVEVTSASKRAQPMADIAAAAYVITAHDIRQSGFRSLPDVLRLAPGVQVAQISSNKWAISIRGFNSLYSNKLLVLVDGRSVYNETSPGVFWESEDLVLEDIARIEIIRGPGGAMWGANAVNGLINIISKSAADTKGWLLRTGAGTFDDGQGLARYGGSLGQAGFRLSSQWTGHGPSRANLESDATDEWDSWTNGLRVDWAKNSQSFIADARMAIASQPRALFLSPLNGTGSPESAGTTDSANGHVLAQWKVATGNGSSLQLQSFASFRHQDDPTARQRQDTFDVDVQYHGRLRRRHDFVAGGGYRKSTGEIDVADTLETRLALTSNIVNVFAQDDISIGKRVTLTLGARTEHDARVGWGFQPTARAIWALKTNHRVWVAASQALRTPSIPETGVISAETAASSETQTFDPERLRDAEVGYRFSVASRATIDMTAFRGRYHHLYSVQPPPVTDESGSPVPSDNGQAPFEAETTGVEIAGHYQPTAAWELAGSYSGLRVTASKTSGDAFDSNAPVHQWQIRSSLQIAERLGATAALSYTGPLREFEIPGYARADVHFDFKVTRALSLRLTGQNLLSRAHREYTVEGFGPVATWVPRSAHLQLAWQR